MKRALAILALATFCITGTPAQDVAPEDAPRLARNNAGDRLAPTAHPPRAAERRGFLVF